MEKIPTATDDRLLDYLDGKLEGAALQLLKKELESSSSLQARLEILRAVHRALAHAKLESPSPAFVNRVMQNLSSVSFPSAWSPRNGLLLLVGVMVAAGILVAMISAGIFDNVQGMVSLEQTLPVKKYFQQSLPVISINGKLIINIIVALNLVLAFLVLDKTVLKPFFQRRAGAHL